MTHQMFNIKCFIFFQTFDDKNDLSFIVVHPDFILMTFLYLATFLFFATAVLVPICFCLLPLKVFNWHLIVLPARHQYRHTWDVINNFLDLLTHSLVWLFCVKFILFNAPSFVAQRLVDGRLVPLCHCLSPWSKSSHLLFNLLWNFMMFFVAKFVAKFRFTTCCLLDAHVHWWQTPKYEVHISLLSHCLLSLMFVSWQFWSV